MSTRLFLEGPDIEALLEQVRQDFGDGATIVHAERIRSGGIGGFFAKQRYALTIEVGAEGDAPASVAEQAPASLPAARAATSRAQISAGTTRGATEMESFEARQERIRRQLEAAGVPEESTLPADDLSRAMEAIRAALGSQGQDGPMPTVSRADSAPARRTPPEDMNAAMMIAAGIDEDELEIGGLRRSTVSVTRTSPSDSARPGVAPAQFPTVSRDADVRRQTAPAAQPQPRSFAPADFPAARASAAAQRPAESRTAQMVAEPIGSVLAATSTGRLPETSTGRHPETSTGRLPETMTSVLADLRRDVAERAELLEDQYPVASVMATAPESTLSARQVTASVRTPSVLPWANPDHQPPTAPRGAGQILLFMGDLELAVRQADLLATRMRLPAGLVASNDSEGLEGRCIQNPLEARRHAARMLTDDRPSILSLEAPLMVSRDAEIRDWATSMIDALLPTVVWAVIDATRTIGVNRRWLASLPRVDALAVVNADLCDDIRDLYELGYPVATFDGNPARFETWRAGALMAEERSCSE